MHATFNILYATSTEERKVAKETAEGSPSSG